MLLNPLKAATIQALLTKEGTISSLRGNSGLHSCLERKDSFDSLESKIELAGD